MDTVKKEAENLWRNEDYYNHYLKTKRFGFAVLPVYNKNEFNKAHQALSNQFARFVFIHNKLSNIERLEFKNDYCDQLEKLKSLQEFSKYRKLIKNRLTEINKRYDNYKSPKVELLKYYNCIRYTDNFKKRLNIDDELYYRDRIKNWKNNRNEKLLENEILNKRKYRLIPFNNRLESLMNKTVTMFKHVVEWKEQSIELHPGTVKIILARKLHPLKEMVTGFKLNYDSDKFLAYQMQQYCINGFDLMLIYLKDDLLIDIQNAPCYYLFKEVVEDYRIAIDVKETELLKQEYQDYILNEISSNKPQQKNKKKKENIHPKIFKNNGFDVFEKLHNAYKDKNHLVANYSFLYYAMTKDELIHCGGVKFIEFLASNYNVQIDRVDSRQSGKNKRTDYYNEIKAQQ